MSNTNKKKKNHASKKAAQNIPIAFQNPIQNVTINTSVYTGNLKSLLEDINHVDPKLLKGLISVYAGFYLDATNTSQYDSTSNNGNNPELQNSPPSPSSQPNKSIDKLTFYIMFRLPFSSSSFNKYYGGPLDSNFIVPQYGISNSTESWSSRANKVRTDFNLKKLNSAGEQVHNFGTTNNPDWRPINDAANDLENFTNQNAYTFLGLVPFDLSITVPTGLDSPTTETTKLFDHAVPYNKIPFYFFNLAIIENPYSSGSWLNTDIYKRKRSPHIPSSVSNKIPYRVPIYFPAGNTNVDGKTIQKDATNNDYYVLINNVQNYLELAWNYSEEVGFENLSLVNSVVKKYGNNYYAESDKKIEDATFDSDSGITFGIGLDTGTSLHGIYKITINISLSGTGTSNIFYGKNKSANISSNVTCVQLKGIIDNLLDAGTGFRDNFNSATPSFVGFVSVTNSQGGTSGTPAIITIIREKRSAYADMIFDSSADFTADNANISLTPAVESTRWAEDIAKINDDWYYFEKTMNHSFDNNPTGNDYWLQQNNLSTAEQTALKKCAKLIIGCNRGRGYAIYWNNLALIKKFEFKSYTQHLRAVYNEFFIPRYYNKSRPINNQATLEKNYAGSIQKNIFENITLKAKPNQAELYAMTSLLYNNSSSFVANSNSIIVAINKHSRKALLDAINGSGMSADRKNHVKELLQKVEIVKNLYRGVSD